MSGMEVAFDVFMFIAILVGSFVMLAVALVGFACLCWYILAETYKHAMRMRRGHVYSHYGRRK